MSTTSVKILVADDNHDILEAVHLMLQKIGNYNVRTVEDKDVLKEINDFMPDLVLLDLWMSDMSGMEICKQLKNNESTQDIPVIVFSASRDLEDIADEIGADDYLPKPFQLKSLMAKISHHTSG